jgi:hypothetical protein
MHLKESQISETKTQSIMSHRIYLMRIKTPLAVHVVSCGTNFRRKPNTTPIRKTLISYAFDGAFLNSATFTTFQI